METSLHKSLKLLHADGPENVEVQFGRFRIDAIDTEQRLVEIQLASLGAIRKKIAALVPDNQVRVVKPIVATKLIQKTDAAGKSVVSSRKSPKRGELRDVFGELIHFTDVFPHPNLVLEVLLVDISERRLPRKRKGWRKKQYKSLDQNLTDLGDRMILRTAADLWTSLGLKRTRKAFDTQWLAEQLDCQRWFAQQVAYVLQRCGTTQLVGKSGNTKMYELVLANKRKPVKRKAA